MSADLDSEHGSSRQVQHGQAGLPLAYRAPSGRRTWACAPQDGLLTQSVVLHGSPGRDSTRESTSPRPTSTSAAHPAASPVQAEVEACLSPCTSPAALHQGTPDLSATHGMDSTGANAWQGQGYGQAWRTGYSHSPVHGGGGLSSSSTAAGRTPDSWQQLQPQHAGATPGSSSPAHEQVEMEDRCGAAQSSNILAGASPSGSEAGAGGMQSEQQQQQEHPYSSYAVMPPTTSTGGSRPHAHMILDAEGSETAPMPPTECPGQGEFGEDGATTSNAVGAAAPLSGPTQADQPAHNTGDATEDRETTGLDGRTLDKFGLVLII